jgi:hypothetical protein
MNDRDNADIGNDGDSAVVRIVLFAVVPLRR